MDDIQRLCDAMKENSEDAEQAAMLEGRAKDSAPMHIFEMSWIVTVNLFYWVFVQIMLKCQ